MRPIPLDIRARIDAAFPQNEREWVFRKLSGYNGKESYRVMRCILRLANGSLSRLEAELNTANQDYRDSILFAEYNRATEQINHFNKRSPANPTTET